MTQHHSTESFFALATGITQTSDDTKESGHKNDVLQSEYDEKPLIEPSDVDEAGETAEDSSASDMPHEARRVLVYLMRQGSIIAAEKAKMFELLCRYETPIRKHLSEVYLQLVLDQRAGVAFIASASFQGEDEDEASNTNEEGLEEATSLISKRTLTLYDTLILLVLRKYYQDRESAGEQKITIDIERLESFLTPFMPITDHATKDRKKLVARVKELVRRKILSSLRGEEDRYEITPIIRYVVNASFLETMLEEYLRLAKQQGVLNVDETHE